jgi:hypothetical protein
MTFGRSSKAGVGIAFTTAAGLIATGVSRLIDERRKRDEELRSILREVVKAYNQAKSTRRMAALGLLDVRSRRLPGRLHAEEVKEELRTIMTELNDAQLRFEAIGRECQQSDLFSRRARRDSVIRELRTAENYINKSVLDKWESDGGGVWGGAEPNVLEELGLRAFIDQGFQENVSKPLTQITFVLQQELFGIVGSRGRWWMSDELEDQNRRLDDLDRRLSAMENRRR